MESTNDLSKAIWQSIKSEDNEGLKQLLAQQVDAIIAPKPLGSWLHVASSLGKLETVQLLVELGIDVNQRGGTFDGNALHMAASSGHLPVVQYLLSKGAEMDTSEPERNPLFGAIYGGHIKVADLLVRNGIDTRVRYTRPHMSNMSALDFAIERGKHDIAALLMSCPKSE